jgi:hypothetical protein
MTNSPTKKGNLADRMALPQTGRSGISITKQSTPVVPDIPNDTSAVDD